MLIKANFCPFFFCLAHCGRHAINFGGNRLNYSRFFETPPEDGWRARRHRTLCAVAMLINLGIERQRTAEA